jgi:RNA ligase
LADLIDPKEEGFVLRWPSGFMCKAKGTEYVRLHRLITQCSTRTIWELLRTGKDTAELLDRVPAEFGDWAKAQIRQLTENHNGMVDSAHGRFRSAPQGVSRKDFAEYAKKQDQPGLLFAMLDGKPIEDMCWKLIEPVWSTPFRGDPE